MWMLLSGGVLSGCAAGPNDETLVDELRVMAVVAEPPEVAPGATTTITVTVADPDSTGATGATWICAGAGCPESPAEGPLPDGRLVTMRTAPLVPATEAAVPLPLWALACAPGACPVDLDAFAADPFTGMEALPLVGTSLALGRVVLSTRADPLVNPLISPEFGEVEADAGASIALAFSVAGGALAYGYATAGGFDATEYAVEDDAVVLTWYAPEEAGDATLYVIVNGEDGGSAVWVGTGRAR